MNLDIFLLESLNQFARTAPVVDVVIIQVTGSNLFKGGVMMALIWWGWFRPHPDQERQRQALLATLLAALICLFMARLLAWSLPFRLRPMHDPAVDMLLPIGLPGRVLQGWSSFPSDHAALFGCLASGMFLVSRRVGWIATAYCVVVIMLPRVYSGMHYPSDLLAGYGLGILFTWLLSRDAIMERAIQPPYQWFMQRPGLWYPLFFLLSYQFATLFNDVRNLGRLGYMIAERMLQA